MEFIQQPLDFNGEDPELVMRMLWAENRRRERDFWTPERQTLSWMQGTTPDDSDMVWWNNQPCYKRKNWMDLHQRERARMTRLKVWRRSFQEAWEELEAILDESETRDEAQIARWMVILRDDFLHGRPCSISLEKCDPSIKDRAEYNLREALPMSRNAAKIPSLTLEITSGACKVQVYGKRSTKGWTVKRTDGARADLQGHQKAKEDAVQLALDCCEPGMVAVFSVRPAC